MNLPSLHVVREDGTSVEIPYIRIYVARFDEPYQYQCPRCIFVSDEFFVGGRTREEAIEQFLQGMYECINCFFEVYLENGLQSVVNFPSEGSDPDGEVGWLALCTVYLRDDDCRELEQIGRKSGILQCDDGEDDEDGEDEEEDDGYGEED
jgi:hypothetical protein